MQGSWYICSGWKVASISGRCGGASQQIDLCQTSKVKVCSMYQIIYTVHACDDDDVTITSSGTMERLEMLSLEES